MSADGALPRLHSVAEISHYVNLQAVADARSVCGFSTKIEVECRSQEEGREAAVAGAEIVMLDNFKPEVRPI